MTGTSSRHAVAHVAYLASDVLVSSNDLTGTLSAFQTTFSQDKKPSTVLTLPTSAADPGSTLLRHRSPGLVSYVGSSDPATVRSLVPALLELADSPVVLHIGIDADLSDVHLLRSVVGYFIYSRDTEETHGYALLASRLAAVERVPILHVFHNTKTHKPIDLIPEGAFPSIISSEKKLANGHANGHPNGHANGSASIAHTDNAFASAASVVVSWTGKELPSYKTHEHNLRDDVNTVIVSATSHEVHADDDETRLIQLYLLKPLPQETLSFVPPSVNRIILLEEIRHMSTKWTPLYLELLGLVQERVPSSPPPAVHSALLLNNQTLGASRIIKYIEESSARPLLIGEAKQRVHDSVEPPRVPKHESSYTKLLDCFQVRGPDFGVVVSLSNLEHFPVQ